ncbi:Oxygen-insensitive NADPH nitroreductase [Streptococcus cristatus]|uniref:Oxygen-insensitive NADPH nitroreductase n=2 Tax=Streptococcus cristatus TaxID=45634 RepID=A0A139N4C9_STRCR|nr:Oxygen-insensitive NADPH nitroreductase [Streptococcus cristatus]
MVQSAQMASSTSFLQAYSIISVDNPILLDRLVKKTHLQPFIQNAGHFFVFCGGFRQHADFAQVKGVDIQNTLEGIDAVIVGSVDASLAAQNMTLAAESLGMGVCYIGGVRDGIEAGWLLFGGSLSNAY